MKVALITGVNGQDGAYLSEFLLKKKYKVFGIKRRSSTHNTFRIDHLFNNFNSKYSNFRMYHADMSDSLSIINVIKEIRPDEIYNLAAQSHVGVSFENPIYTANSDGIGALRILESIRILGLEQKTKFYQASTSELYGDVKEIPQNEKTEFNPVSPYAVAKLYAHNITKVYRDAYGIFACNGILFNHESPLRGESFVSKKIVRGLVNIKKGNQKKLFLGNLNAKRDWGHAKDYVKMMWKMLNHKEPMDFVISTGKNYSVREFIKETAKNLNMKISFSGNGLNEKIYNENNKAIIEVKKQYFRPNEVNELLGDSTKAKKVLNWKPKYDFKTLVEEMVREELNDLQK